MKIRISKNIEVPDKMICHFGRRQCSALTETQNMNVRVCANFNDYCFWSDKAGYYVRCKSCIEAHLKYLREKK